MKTKIVSYQGSWSCLIVRLGVFFKYKGVYLELFHLDNILEKAKLMHSGRKHTTVLAGKGWEQGLTTKDFEGSLWIEVFILDFDGHWDLCICQNPLNYPDKMRVFVICKLNFSKRGFFNF